MTPLVSEQRTTLAARAERRCTQVVDDQLDVITFAMRFIDRFAQNVRDRLAPFVTTTTTTSSSSGH